MKIKYLLVVSLFTTVGLVHAQESWTSGRPDGHAPITVMGDHTHGKGDWMVSYRLMAMQMKGLRDGTKDISTETALGSYMMVPETMNMNMHMLGLMYAISDRITLMAMTSYIENDMSMIMMMNGMTMNFNTASSGMGDLKISSLLKFFDGKGQRLHANMGLSIPTGSIDNSDETPMSSPNETQLPYPMQIGSGTYNLMPGVTYMGQKNNLSWGSQAMGNIRLGENDRGYAFGNQVSLLGWLGYRTTEWLSISLKANGSSIGEITGSDPSYMNPGMSPTLQTENFGGRTVTGGIGFNVYIPNGAFKNIRIGAEYELPVYQNLNGPQMKTTNQATFGLQYSW